MKRVSRRRFLGDVATGLTITHIPALAADPTNSADQKKTLTSLTLRQAADLLTNRSVSSVDLTRACLQRIESRQPKLNAFITVTAEKALSQARQRDREMATGMKRSPLHGIPIAIKDNIDTAGIRTSAASAHFADRIPSEDAEVIRRLLESGAVILGKLNLEEFAAGVTTTSTYFGSVHNPWALDRSASGSSGGSGAAVADELCFAALGTDTGGSVRGPAAACGIVGLKPTYGRVSNRGVIPLSWTLDHVGPMCRTVEDTAIVLQQIAGYDAADTTTVDVPVPDFVAESKSPGTAMRIGVPRAQFYDKLNVDVESAVNEALKVLKKLTAEIREIELPSTATVYTALSGAETFAYHAPLFARNPQLYQTTLRRRLETASKVSASDYVLLRRDVDRLRREIRKSFTNVDVFVTPTTKLLPRTIEECQQRAEAEKPLPPELSNTNAFNILGLPAISLPCGFAQAGLPIGLQIVGAPWAEARVLALARAYEQATDWHKRRPPADAT